MDQKCFNRGLYVWEYQSTKERLKGESDSINPDDTGKLIATNDDNLIVNKGLSQVLID